MTTTPLSKNNLPRLLITGSEGSLAQWIIKKISSQYNIIGVDNCARHGVQERDRNYTFQQGDLCDINWVDRMFDHYRPDYVIHAAAQIYGVVGFHKYSADILGINASSTYSVLAACAKYAVKKVAYISSSMVYERSETAPFREEQVDDLPCPYTGYGFSKLFGEKLLKEYNKQYGLNYVIWRPFNIVTPLEHFENEPGIAHVIPDMIKKIVIDRQQSIEILGTGEQTRCFTWIGDVADLVSQWSWDPVTDRQEFNIGGDTPITMIDLCKIIWSKTRIDEQFSCHHSESFPDDVIVRIPDYSKSQRTFGWSHSKTLEEMIDICLQDI
jgi:nucleoside-diphosphate-sugar epimerase